MGHFGAQLYFWEKKNLWKKKVTEEQLKEATDKLQKANSKHIGLESISIVLKRILDCIIVSIVAHLS